MKRQLENKYQVSNLRHYLEVLDNTPQLLLVAETELMTKIASLRATLFNSCSEFPYFRRELVKLLNSKIRESVNNVPKQTGILESSTNIHHYRTQVRDLIKILESVEWRTAFKQLDMTGNFAMSLLNMFQVKHKFSKRMKALSDLQKFFGAKSIPLMLQLVEQCHLRTELRQAVQDHLGVPMPVLMQKLRAVTSHSEDYQKYLHLKVCDEDQPQLKKIFKLVDSAEKEVRPLQQEAVQKNLRLVVARAKYFIGRGLDFEELIQEGNLGLLKAVEKYHVRHGAKLGTYATWWIDQTIKRAIANKSKTIRIPTHIQGMKVAVRDITAKLSTELNRSPTDQEVADDMMLPVDKVKKLNFIAQHSLPLDRENEDGSFSPTHTRIEGAELNPFHVTAQRLLREDVQILLSILPPLSEKIIRLKFGIGVTPATFERIGEKLQLSYQTTRNKFLSALRKLREEGKDIN